MNEITIGNWLYEIGTSLGIGSFVLSACVMGLPLPEPRAPTRTSGRERVFRSGLGSGAVCFALAVVGYGVRMGDALPLVGQVPTLLPLLLGVLSGCLLLLGRMLWKQGWRQQAPDALVTHMEGQQFHWTFALLVSTLSVVLWLGLLTDTRLFILR